MMSRVKQALLKKVRIARGFTLTEMLVALLILVLASTLLATGVPVALDTYHKTVNSSNAQIALSTTATVLRSELGLSTEVAAPTTDKVYFTDADGTWISIQNNSKPNDHRGLEKQYYVRKSASTSDTVTVNVTNAGGTVIDVVYLEKDGDPYQLMSDAAITDELTVAFDSVSPSSNGVSFTNLEITDTEGNTLASIASYEVLTRFAN